MKQEKYAEFTLGELDSKLQVLRSESLTLRLQLASGKLVQKHLYKIVKKQIARVLTQIRIKQDQ